MRNLSRIQIAFAALAFIVAALVASFYAISEPDIPRATLEAEFGQPPSQFVNLPDGTRAHYRVSGPADAPTVVLLHGFMGSLFVWEPWRRELSGRFRIIAVDLPGHGLTGAVPSGDYSHAAMVEFLKGFTDAIHLKRFALAGNSMGGDVAAHFAERHPDRASALILLDAAGAQTGPRERRNLIGLVAGFPFAETLASYLPPCWLFPVAPHRPDASGRCGSAPIWQMARMPGVRAAMVAHYRLPPDNYVWAHVRDICAPTLILWGENDHTIPIASAHAWHNAIAGSKLITYPHAGHVLMLDAAKATARDVASFLQR